MKTTKKELSLVILNEGPEEVWKHISSKINAESISDPRLLELAMRCLIYKGDIKLLIKYLNVDKVPPKPIDTSYDLGRRFFYLLKIISYRSGYQLIEPYLQDITCKREQEFCFLGGIYFDGVNLEKAKDAFERAINLVNPSSYNVFSHRHLFHNYLLCLSYLDETQKFHEFIKKNISVLKRFDSMDHVRRLELMEIIKSDDVSKAPAGFKEHFGFNIDEPKDSSTGVLNLQLSYFSKIGDEKNFLIFLDLYKKNLFSRLGDGVADPTRVIGYLKYIFALGGKSEEEMYKQIGEKFSFYPYYQVNFSPCLLHQNKNITLGSKESDNYFYPKIEEFQINGVRGVGYSKEVKLIYHLILAGVMGMSFEELSLHINGEHDYAGLLLLHGRIKQVLLRVKKIYGITIERKNYRAYINAEDRSKFFVSVNEHLSIKDQFSKTDFMNYYSVSQFTAKVKLKSLVESGDLKVEKIGAKNIYSKVSKPIKKI